ncbi:MAG TPA: 3-phosphoshikimate 1-carboxyvinyltransferase [Clostridiales bacterium]|nr:3-phosphoshikimate 1-carboxyvinyltransferase [Clostridiales bacterium]
MSDLMIRPGLLRGTVTPPPSKSDAHRALIAASLAGRPDLVGGLPLESSEDIQATRRCLAALAKGTIQLDCGESGTTLRLLIPVIAALGAARQTPVILAGSGRLPLRPLADYLAILTGHGVQLEFPPGASLPLRLSGQLTGGLFEVPGHISSQYVSGLLLALPLLEEDSVIRLTSPLESAPYVDMTLRTLKTFGIAVEKTSSGYRVPGGQHYRPTAYQVEKDYSQAAFWLTAAYAGSPLTVTGLNPESVQGDRVILQLLDDFRQGRAVYEIDAAQIPDLVPALAVAAALAAGDTRFVRAGRLRLKESDRLQATQQALQAIGADIVQTDDGLLVRGSGKSGAAGCLAGGTADSWADHRIAMALAIAALSTRNGVLLRRAEAVNKSYPDFFTEFSRLGGDIDGILLGTKPEAQPVR